MLLLVVPAALVETAEGNVDTHSSQKKISHVFTARGGSDFHGG